MEAERHDVYRLGTRERIHPADRFCVCLAVFAISVRDTSAFSLRAWINNSSII